LISSVMLLVSIFGAACSEHAVVEKMLANKNIARGKKLMRFISCSSVYCDLRRVETRRAFHHAAMRRNRDAFSPTLAPLLYRKFSFVGKKNG
jgi:hypothetical protein